MRSKEVRFLAAILFQVGLLLCVILFKVLVFADGRDILLKIAPIDPRDPLRGDYVTFRYDVSSVSTAYSLGEQIRNGDTVYVTLKSIGMNWRVMGVQKSKPTISDDTQCIKGVVQSGGTDTQEVTSSPRSRLAGTYNVKYGIEDYFIPEGAGQGFVFNNQQTTAKVTVDSDCNAVLKQIYVDGTPWP